MNLTVLKKVSRELPAKVRGPQRTETVGTPLEGGVPKGQLENTSCGSEVPVGPPENTLVHSRKEPEFG